MLNCGPSYISANGIECDSVLFFPFSARPRKPQFSIFLISAIGQNYQKLMKTMMFECFREMLALAVLRQFPPLRCPPKPQNSLPQTTPNPEPTKPHELKRTGVILLPVVYFVGLLHTSLYAGRSLDSRRFFFLLCPLHVLPQCFLCFLLSQPWLLINALFLCPHSSSSSHFLLG